MQSSLCSQPIYTELKVQSYRGYWGVARTLSDLAGIRHRPLLLLPLLLPPSMAEGCKHFPITNSRLTTDWTAVRSTHVTIDESSARIAYF